MQREMVCRASVLLRLLPSSPGTVALPPPSCAGNFTRLLALPLCFVGVGSYGQGSLQFCVGLFILYICWVGYLLICISTRCVLNPLCFTCTTSWVFISIDNFLISLPVSHTALSFEVLSQIPCLKSHLKYQMFLYSSLMYARRVRDACVFCIM